MEKLQKYFLTIEKGLKNIIEDQEEDFKEMYQMMAYHLGWIDEKGKACQDKKTKGKRIRPALLLYIYELLGGKAEKALLAALAIELFHNFSLIHDDIEDHDKYRRGKLALWKKIGQEQAINAGDGMLILSQIALLKLKEKDFSAGAILKVAKLFNKTFLKIVEGQFLDMSFEKKIEISKKDYLLMIERKTAALFGATFACPPILKEEKNVEDFWKLGLLFGLLYQIWDDYLGIWGKKENTGKKGFSDIQKKKKTYPIIYAFSNPFQEKKRLFQIYNQDSKPSSSEIQIIISLLEKSGAKKATLKLVDYYKQKIFKEIKNNSSFGKIKKPILLLFEEIWQKIGIEK